MVRGRVVAADTGLPLRRAKVSLRDAREPQGRSVTTDAAGAFAFAAVPKGRYRLRASKARYVDAGLGARRPGAPGRAFDVADGQKVENLTIVLATAGVITGRVLDDGGEPMTGAVVMALRQRTVNGATRLEPSEHAGSTDDTGTYRLFGLEPGRYYLSVRADDDRFAPDVDASVTGLAPTYYPSTPVASEAQPIDVAAGAEAVADITLLATRVTTVSGEVLDAAGRPPIAGMVMLNAGSDGAAGRFQMAVVRPGGAFTLSGVAPGDYTMGVRVFFDDAETLQIASTGRLENNPAFSLPLSVSGTPIEDLRIVVPPPVDVPGRVVFEGGPPAGAVLGSVSASTANGGMSGEARGPVGPDGRFTLRLRPGTWRFGAWTPPGWMIKRITFRGTAVDEDEAAEVTSEGGRLEVLLTSQLTAVTGTVSDAAGAPVVDYHAIVFPAEQTEPAHGRRHRTRLDTSDAQGRFRIDRLAPGDYLVAAVVDLEPGEAVSDDTVDAVRESATAVRVREGQTETVALKLAPLP
jgi:protocatechuate 3,4-dioxygenase beta subunit